MSKRKYKDTSNDYSLDEFDDIYKDILNENHKRVIKLNFKNIKYIYNSNNSNNEESILPKDNEEINRSSQKIS